MGMLFFCELYVIRDELALLGRTARHPRSWASTSYNYTIGPGPVPRCRLFPPLWGEENRHFGSLRPASLRRHMRSAAPFSPQFCTCAPTAERRCPLGSVHAGEQPHRSRSATVSRSERSAQATRPPLAALATDLIASSISRPSASKLSMMDIVDREADAERPRGG